MAVPLACHSQQSCPAPSGQPGTTPRRLRPAPFPTFAGGHPARSGFASRRSGRSAGGDPNPNGPRWVRMTPATSGTRRARAVTRGRLNPQVSARSWHWPGQAEESDSGFESHLLRVIYQRCRTGLLQAVGRASISGWWCRRRARWPRDRDLGLHGRLGCRAACRELGATPAGHRGRAAAAAHGDRRAGAGPGLRRGLVARTLAKQGAQVTGVDLSEQMIGHARSQEAAAPLGIAFRVGDAQTLARVDGRRLRRRGRELVAEQRRRSGRGPGGGVAGAATGRLVGIHHPASVL
jgi:hypothetical protein